MSGFTGDGYLKESSASFWKSFEVNNVVVGSIVGFCVGFQAIWPCRRGDGQRMARF